MEEHDEQLEGLVQPEPPELDEEEAKTLFDQLRARRREIQENRQTYVSIPGYEEIGLCAQYHLLDGKIQERIVEKVKRQTKDRVDRGLFVAVDTMIQACDGLFLERDGQYIPFDPDRRGFAFKYEKALADFLEYEADTARRVVFGLFGNNDSMIAAHVMKLNRWFQNTTRDADEEFAGDPFS